MKIDLFNLNRQLTPLKKSFQKAFEDVFDKNEFTYGAATKKLEEDFSKYVGTKYSLAVRSGTSALIVALKALGFKEGDEIITTPMTFSATTDAIIFAGAKPVFADIEKNSANISLDEIKKAKTKKTKAVLLVHFAGVPCEMDEIVSFCKENKLFLIEDAAHSHGSTYKGRKTGSFGDFACFSFYPSKTFGSLGNAGIITTNNKELLRKASMFAEHGIDGEKYQHHLIGFNEKIDNLQAAFLNVKFPFLEDWIKKKIKIAKKYQKIFSEKGVKTVLWSKDIRPSLYVFSIFIKEREKFAKYMLDNGVKTGIYYPVPLHLQKSLKFLGYKKGDFPNAEHYAKETLSMPLYSELKEEEVDYICDLIKNYKF